MKRTFFPALILQAFVIGLFLQSCTALGFSQPLTPSQSVYAVQAQFGATVQALRDYAEQPVCRPPAVITMCHDKAVLAVSLSYAQKADTAIAEAVTVVRLNPQGDIALSAITTARSALAALSQYLVQQKVTPNA